MNSTLQGHRKLLGVVWNSSSAQIWKTLTIAGSEIEIYMRRTTSSTFSQEFTSRRVLLILLNAVLISYKFRSLVLATYKKISSNNDTIDDLLSLQLSLDVVKQLKPT